MITTICLKFFLVFIIAKCVVLTESFVNLNQNNNEIERDKLHGIVMGKVFHGCDDAKASVGFSIRIIIIQKSFSGYL